MHATPIPLTNLVVSTLNVRKALDAGQEDSNVEELAASYPRERPVVTLDRPSAYGRAVRDPRRPATLSRLQARPARPGACLIREGLSDTDAISLSLIENVHRADMHSIDKAKALQALYAKHGS